MPNKPKTKQPATVPTVAENQKAAAKLWEIPLSVIRAAKSVGCGAFVGSRVHREPLLEWLRDNSAAAAGAAAADIEKADKQALELQRLRAVTRLAIAKADQADRLTILRSEAKDEWARAIGILEQEFSSLMEADHYRIAIVRAKSRIGQLHDDEAAQQKLPKNGLTNDPFQTTV